MDGVVVSACLACDADVPLCVAIDARAPGTRAALVTRMNNLMRGGIAGLGAWWLGGGVFSTLLIFGLIWWFLGHH